MIICLSYGDGRDDLLIEDAAAIVFEHTNWVRVCRDGKADESFVLGVSDQAVSVCVVPRG